MPDNFVQQPGSFQGLITSLLSIGRTLAGILTSLNKIPGVAGILTVVNGGTGAATFTTHGVLVGEGTGSIVATAAGAANTVLTGQGAADPTFSGTPTVNTITLANGAAGQTALGFYGEGTWTPALQFGGSATGITYSVQSGTYTRCGREVEVRFRLVLTSKGVQVGAATIAGLPFTANADATGNGNAGIAPVYANLAALTGVPVLTIAPSTTAISLLSSGAAASAALADTNFTNTTTINGSARFFV